jgi:hypothetical protein
MKWESSPSKLSETLKSEEMTTADKVIKASSWCYGKTPMLTFIDSLPLAKEKMI